MTTDDVMRQLARAGLPARQVARADEVNRRIRQTSGGAAAFLMDIRRTRVGNVVREEILIHPGVGTRVVVPSVDRARRQALVVVQEPERVVESTRWDPVRRRPFVHRTRVPAAKRQFLVGMDEQHLFVCGLARRVATVEEAHRALAPEQVHEERRRQRGVRRQGEWFFLPVGDAVEREEIEAAVRRGELRRHVGLGRHLLRRGRPHLVEETLRLESEEYARGVVRHPDHRPLRLPDWHRVVANVEAPLPAGTTWVD